MLRGLLLAVPVLTAAITHDVKLGLGIFVFEVTAILLTRKAS